MAKYSGKKRISEATREEGLQIAKSTQRAGQTKEQTRLIAQGIQRGIDLYKKQHKARARELDRKLRQAHGGRAADPQAPAAGEVRAGVEAGTGSPGPRPLLPWLLLALTWLGIGAYLLLPDLRALLAG